MPVLNREDTIEKAIKSVINQHYANTELIILDGGSTDNTIEIIKKYAAYITYWCSQKDGNPVIAMNEGVKKASGDLIAFLMADDWYELGLFERVKEAYLSADHIDVVTCGGRVVVYNVAESSYKIKRIISGAKYMRLNLYNICFVDATAICCRFISKKLYQKIGLYQVANSSGKHMLSGDKEFLLRAVLSSINEVYINFIGHNYLAHHQSSTFGGNRANTYKLFYEHMDISKIYMQKSCLSSLQKKIFSQWYCDQAARLFIYQLIDKNYQEALCLAKKVLIKYPIQWPISFISTSLRIVLQKSRAIFARI